MPRSKSPSFRVYQAALLDYMLVSGESGLAQAYELGREALHGGRGLLQLLELHARAVNTILESTPAADEVRRRVKVSSQFLAEALSPFEMMFHGYGDLLRTPEKRRQRMSTPGASHESE